jgi:hypothetical protein
VLKSHQIVAWGQLLVIYASLALAGVLGVRHSQSMSERIKHARGLYALLLLLLSLAVSVWAKPPQHKKPHKAQPIVDIPAEPAPAPPQPPPPPPTPEQGPSSPPEVSFQGGQLTIVARNSTMGDVLTAVKQKTGAAVEMPAVSSERVVGRFGPGAPRDVMAQLLNGSHYDYVLLGSPADPGALRKVVLVARVSGPEPVASEQPQQSPQSRFQNPNFQPNPNLQQVPEVETEQEGEENNAETQPEVQQPEEQPQPEQPNGPPGVKTPEQLLRELQQQQQQQQQQQEQQPPPGAPGAPPPQ